MDAVEEIKSSIARIGEANEAFRKALDEVKKADVVTDEKIARIEKSLDSAIEAKAAIEAAVAAERKEREELELRLSRRGGGGGSDLADEMKSMQILVAGLAAKSGRPAAVLDEAGYTAYKAAQRSYLARGREALSHDEVKAMSVGGDPQGGYFVTPDVTGRMVKKAYETSPVRQIASVQAISTDALDGMEDLGEAGANWTGETGTRSETTTPDVGKWSIPVFYAYAMPKATQQLLDDASVNIEMWLADKAGERIGRLENTAFVTGTGVGQPKGFTTYTTAADSGSGVTWGTIGHVVSGASADFAASNPADKLLDLVGLVKDVYLGNARWCTRRSVITKIRKFKDGQGQYLWQPGLTAGAPEMILGYPVTRAEDVPALASASKSLYFGDFAAGYQIVDRQGIRVLNDPYTAKPYVLFYTTKRVGGAVVNFEAIKAMIFSAS